MNKSRIDNKFIILLFAIALILGPTGRNCALAANDSNRPTLYFFTNEGCRPCKQVEPVLRELAERGYPITKVDTNEYPSWVREFQVASTPTVVMVRGSTELSRKSGFVNAATIERWFNDAGFALRDQDPRAKPAEVVINKQDRAEFVKSVDRKRNSDVLAGDTSTIHKGTRIPANRIEKLAMDATVRLRVEDPEGISFATGTVIHSHEGEWLVMTCGHVFRDANGKGVITVEYGFEDGNPSSASGKLISYDAKARDIGLVAVKAGVDITPFPVATRNTSVDRGSEVFTIGCDHGQLPTIRRTKIKNKAAYDKVVKYDIYGRPVDGRSGGGLFSDDGRMLGVCNAASVDFDEGIYTGLDTIYWQIAQVNLGHLFDNNNGGSIAAIANNDPKIAPNNPRRNPVQQVGSEFKPFDDRRLARADLIPSTIAEDAPSKVVPAFAPLSRDSNTDQQFAGTAERAPWDRSRTVPPERYADSRPLTDVNWQRPDGNGVVSSTDMEVIMIVRSKKDPTRAEAITLTDPSPKLLNYLEKLAHQQSGNARIDMAQLRKHVVPLQQSGESVPNITRERVRTR